MTITPEDAAPDINDKIKLKIWLEQHPDLSTYDLVMLTGKSPSTIRNWKKKFGLKMKDSPFRSFKHSYVKREVEVIADQSIWDNKEWFHKKYEDERNGAPTIARMIDRSIVLVVGRLKRYGIKMRQHSDAVKSDSKFCSKEWLLEHYVTQGWSLKKCADAAGVVPYTIYNWLVKFGVEPRSIHEAMAGDKNPFFGKRHSEETKKKIRETLQSHMLK